MPLLVESPPAPQPVAGGTIPCLFPAGEEDWRGVFDVAGHWSAPPVAPARTNRTRDFLAPGSGGHRWNGTMADGAGGRMRHVITHLIIGSGAQVLRPLSRYEGDLRAVGRSDRGLQPQPGIQTGQVSVDPRRQRLDIVDAQFPVPIGPLSDRSGGEQPPSVRRQRRPTRLRNLDDASLTVMGSSP